MPRPSATRCTPTPTPNRAPSSPASTAGRWDIHRPPVRRGTRWNRDRRQHARRRSAVHLAPPRQAAAGQSVVLSRVLLALVLSSLSPPGRRLYAHRSTNGSRRPCVPTSRSTGCQPAMPSRPRGSLPAGCAQIYTSAYGGFVCCRACACGTPSALGWYFAANRRGFTAAGVWLPFVAVARPRPGR